MNLVAPSLVQVIMYLQHTVEIVFVKARLCKMCGPFGHPGQFTVLCSGLTERNGDKALTVLVLFRLRYTKARSQFD